MGSFKNLGARIADQRTITIADRPLDRYEDIDGERTLVQREVPVEDWLAEGESITFWTRMPHGAAADIADAATTAVIAEGMGRAARRRNRGAAQVQATYSPGKAALATFVLGIVGFELRDENDKPVQFELLPPGQFGWEERAKVFMSGLPGAVVAFLQEFMGEDAPPSLASLPADAETEDDTLGNDSGAN